MHKLDVCVADTATGEVKALIEERLNTLHREPSASLADKAVPRLLVGTRGGRTSTSMTPTPGR